VLLKELGKGGMGHVFMALTGQAGVERVCALKVLKEVRASRDAEELTQRFLDEAKVVTKLSHENLVYVFDFGIHERQGYLAMEYVRGKSITETWNRCAARRDGFPMGLSLYYISELVSALWYAANVEGLGLVHRDISPSNVMLTYTGGVKLIDFGLAKWKAKVVQTATGVQWGKTSYMSPEQYSGKPVDHRSDLFSAGVILWELLTGRQLFPPSDTRLPATAGPPPSRYTRGISPTLDRLVAKALALDPAERFQTGEEMCAALLAEMPEEGGGKLQAAKFVARLFETEIREEAAEQRELLDRAAHMESVGSVSAGGAALVDESLDEGDTTPDPDPDGLLGKVLCERYYIRRLVGEGAMGRVYEGHHTGVGKRVAIKIAHQVERRRSELAKRIQREALAPAQIGHPNVADVTDCGTTPNGEFFFVMEFIDGTSLDAVIKRDGQFEIERALAVAAQICRALEAAHRAGIIHRDLKPSNVMLVRSPDQEELVKVLDFGVAKFLYETGDAGNLTLTNASVGTPKYMAPEQIRGGSKADFRSDIYALGAILYTMLSGGRPPFEGATVDELWQHKLGREPRPLAEFRSDLPRDLEALVLRCLARAPEDRPQSAEALKRQLVHHLEEIRATSESILGMKSPSRTEIVSERLRKRRARLGMVVGALSTLAVVGAGVLFIGPPSSHRQPPPKAAPAPPKAAPGPSPTPPAGLAPPAVPTPAVVPLATPKTAPAAEPAPAAAPAARAGKLAEFAPGLQKAPPARAAAAGKQAEAGLPVTPPPSPPSTTASPGAPPTTASAGAPPPPPAPGSESASSPPASEPSPPPTSEAIAPPTSKPPTPAAGEAEEQENTAANNEAAAAAIAKAEATFTAGRLAAAHIAATEAVAAAKKASTPLKTRAHIIMGKVELASEKFPEAERWFNRALAIDPDNPVARKGKERTQEAAEKRKNQ